MAEIASGIGVVKGKGRSRREPASSAAQSCRSLYLAVKPAAEVYRYQDGFGNRAHPFNQLPARGCPS
jgi:hypothetical protein